MSVVDIPEDVFESIRIPDREKDKELKVELAVSLYSRGALSFGKARQLADVSHERFQEILADREIERHYTEEEFEEDLQYAEE